MKILFTVFGIPVHFFGIMIAIGVLAGVYVGQREAKCKGLNIERYYDIVLYGILSAIAGARLFYILFYDFGSYMENPIRILKVNEGGLSIHGGLLGAFIFGFFYIRKHKLNFFQYADAAAPGIILGQGIGRIGCDVFGKPVTESIFWAVRYGGQLLHPVQVYELMLNYLVFFILWRKRRTIRYDGQLFFWYVILFSINRGIVELFRINPSVAGWFSISHLLSLAFILGAAVCMLLIKRYSRSYEAKSGALSAEKGVLLKEILVLLGLMIASLAIYYGAWR